MATNTSRRSPMDVVRGGRTVDPKQVGAYQEPQVMGRVRCADGTTLSVQASTFHYSTPRNDVGPYTAVEVWFPGEEEPRGYVPVAEVEAFVEAHGGEA